MKKVLLLLAFVGVAASANLFAAMDEDDDMTGMDSESRCAYNGSDEEDED
jgi:hypothetical protein